MRTHKTHISGTQKEQCDVIDVGVSHSHDHSGNGSERCRLSTTGNSRDLPLNEGELGDPHPRPSPIQPQPMSLWTTTSDCRMAERKQKLRSTLAKNHEKIKDKSLKVKKSWNIPKLQRFQWRLPFLFPARCQNTRRVILFHYDVTGSALRNQVAAKVT